MNSIFGVGVGVRNLLALDFFFIEDVPFRAFFKVGHLINAVCLKDTCLGAGEMD